MSHFDGNIVGLVSSGIGLLTLLLEFTDFRILLFAEIADCRLVHRRHSLLQHCILGFHFLVSLVQLFVLLNDVGNLLRRLLIE